MRDNRRREDRPARAGRPVRPRARNTAHGADGRPGGNRWDGGRWDGPLPRGGDRLAAPVWRGDWLDEAAAELLLDGGTVAPPASDERAALAAARLTRLLAAARAAGLPRSGGDGGGPPVDPRREEAALAAFRASRRARALRRLFRLHRAGQPSSSRRVLRVSTAAVVSALAVGSMAVAVASGRYFLPGDGAGAGPVSRPPAAVSSNGATATPPRGSAAPSPSPKAPSAPVHAPARTPAAGRPSAPGAAAGCRTPAGAAAAQHSHLARHPAGTTHCRGAHPRQKTRRPADNRSPAAPRANRRGPRALR